MWDEADEGLANSDALKSFDIRTTSTVMSDPAIARQFGAGYSRLVPVSVDAIVALKARAQSKMRLTSVLGDTAREALVEAMAADVLSCLLMHPEIEAVHVISGAGWSER